MAPGPRRAASVGRAASCRAALLALAVALTGAPAAAEDRALVVGIDDYGGAAGHAGLAGAVADARRVRDLLTGPWGFEPDQVTLLENEEATSRAILEALTNELLGRTRPGDRAVFYFAGLGAIVSRGAEEGAVPAIVAHDAGSLLGRIPGDMFADLLDLIAGRRVTVVIDASFAGAAPSAGDVRPRSMAAEEEAGRPAALFGQGQVEREVWNAAGPGQAAWEAEGAGVFTGAFLDGLAGGAEADGDGEVSDAELLAFVVDRAGAWCQAHPACAGTERGFAPAFASAAAPAAAPILPPTEPPPSGQDEFEDLVGFAREALASTNPAGLQLSLDGPEPLRIGDTAALRLAADRPGQVLLLELQAATGLSVLGWAPLASPGEPLSLSVRMSEPAGPGALIGILLDMAEQEAEEALPDAPASDPRRFLQELSDGLRRLGAGTGVEWSAAVLPYEVAP